MNEKIKNIIPGKGLGSLKFGMHRQDVKNILGIPNKIKIYRYTTQLPDETEIWFYEDLKLDVSFSSDDEWKMDTISINSNFYKLWDSIYIGQTMLETKTILKNKEISNFKHEDLSSLESPDHKLIDLIEQDINLWFDYQKLSEIQWGPFFEDENTIIWPYESQYDKNEIDLGIKTYESNHLFQLIMKHSNDWLDKIFSSKSENEDLIMEFPIQTERENLKTVYRSIEYSVKTKNKVQGTIKANARIEHNEYGDLGYIAIEWDNELNIIDDYLVIENE